MWIFQAPYDALKRFKCRWFCDLMGWIESNILWPALQAVGQKGKEAIIQHIKDAAGMDISNEEKFKYVFNESRKVFDMDTISNDLLNTIISLLYSVLKSKGIV